MNERYINPTKSMKLKLLASNLALLMVAFAMDIWWAPFMSYVRALPACEELPYLRSIFVVFALFFWFASFASWNSGVKILHAGESPVPTAWVLFRTRIKTGWRAKADGYAMLTVALLAAVVPIVAGFGLKVNVIFCFPTSCGC